MIDNDERSSACPWADHSYRAAENKVEHEAESHRKLGEVGGGAQANANACERGVIKHLSKSYMTSTGTRLDVSVNRSTHCCYDLK
jgi:hypothetical protein